MGEDYLRTVEESEKEIQFGGRLYQEIITNTTRTTSAGASEAQRGNSGSTMKPKTPNGQRVYRHMWDLQFTCIGVNIKRHGHYT